MRFRALLLTVLFSGMAFGQGVSFQGPKIESQSSSLQPIPGLTVVVCQATSTGTPCTPTVSVFSDSALTVPIVSLQTDGDGMFPTFFVSPGQYQWCASDPVQLRISAYCTKFTAPASSGSSPTFVNLTVTGNETVGGTLGVTGKATLALYSGVCDASTYAGADAGAKINAAEADSNCVMVDATSFTSPTAAATITATKPLLLGAYTLSVSGAPGISIPNTFSYVKGKGRNLTIVSTTSGTADIIAVPSATEWYGIFDLSILSSVARTAGAGIRGSGGHATIERVVVYPVFDGIVFDTANNSGISTVRDTEITNGTGSPSAGSGGTWRCGITTGGVAVGTVSGITLDAVTVSMNTAFTDAGICIKDGSDTIMISNSQAVANIGGSDSVPLHIETVNGGATPSNIQVVNSTLEGGLTKNGAVIDSGLNVKFSSVTVQSSLNGIVVNSCVACSFMGGTVHLNQQHGLRLVSAFYTTIAGNHFSDNSQAVTNTSDDISVAANVTNFQIRGNFHADFSVTGKVCKWGVEIAAGTSNNYVVDDVNPGSCATGSVSDSGTGTNKRVCTLGNSCNFGNSSLQLMGSGSGTATIQAPAAAGTPTLTLPTATGTLGELSGSQTFFQACSGTANSSTTLGMQFVPGACTSSSTAIQLPVASAGTLTNLRVRCGTGGKVAGSGVFTLNKSGAGSALTCTVGTGTTCNDTTHTVSVSAGDTQQIVFTTQATETLADCAVSWEKQ